MAQDLGTGYILIQPSTKGLGKAIEDPLNTAVQSASKSGGRTILSKVGGAFKTVGKVGLAAIGTIGGGLAALTAKGGFDRALNIERAQTKLKALGHDTQSVDAIMDDALKSVQGTAFGLGDAASVAATLVASGIQSGTQLQQVLGTVGDAAQIAGVGFKDMGVIFSQVAAKGKLQGDEMLQLMQAGIPVLQYLADHYGITTAAAQEMVSAGKVSFADFEAAMREHIGGAAQSAGESFDGAMGNVKAALSRLGETVATPVINGLTSMANQAIPIIDNFTATAQPALEKVGTAIQTGLENALPAIGNFFSQAQTVVGQAVATIQSNIGQLMATLAPIVQQVIGTLKGVWDSFTASFSSSGGTLSGLLGVASTIVSLMSPLGAARVLFEQFGGQIQQIASTIGPQLVSVLNSVAAVLGGAIGGLLPGIQSAISAFLPVIGQIITTVGQIAATVMPVISSLVSQLVPVITQIAQVVSQLMATLAPIIANLVSTLLPVIQNIVSALMNLAQAVMPIVMQVISTVMSLIQMLMPVIQTIATVISSVIGVIVTVIGQIISLVTNVVAVVVSAVSQVTGVISGIISVVSSVFGTILSVISSVVSGVVSAVTGAFNTVVNVISSAVSSVVAFITGLASSISSTFSGIASTIGNAINGAANALRAGFSGMVSAAGSFVGNLMSTIGGIPGRIQSAFSGAASWLVSAGRNIIQGLINGITGAISGAISAVQNAVGGIIDGAKSLLGIHSPSTVFRDEIGRMIGEGLAIGIRRETGTVSKAGSELARAGMPAAIPLPVVDTSAWLASVRRTAASMTVELASDRADGASTDGEGSSDIATLLRAILAAIADADTTIQLDGREVGRLVRRYANA